MTRGSKLFQLLALSLFLISSSLHGEEILCNPSSFHETESKEEHKNNESASLSKEVEGDKTEAKKSDDVKCSCSSAEHEAIKYDEPPKIGNFSLPDSQQPAALFGFGGNVIEKGEVQLFFFADEFIGKNKIISDLIPGVLFGITDEWTIFFNFPFTPILKDGCSKSNGLEDFFVQLEYAFYVKTTCDSVDQATILGNITFPTGSVHRNPATGFGSPTFFIGGTYFHTMVDWVLFTAHGALLTQCERGTKYGDQFFYQFGIGRNLPSPCGWIYAWMIELDGQYNKKNRIDGFIDNNSGGNIIFVTPSLWFSTRELILQFGVSLPVNQNLFGNQRKISYGFNFNIAWSFY